MPRYASRAQQRHEFSDWCLRKIDGVGNRKGYYLLTGLLIALWSWASVQPSLAATASAGSDPTQPLLPSNAWVALADNARHWYAFRDEGDATAINIRLTILPANGANFRVLTPAQVAQWERGAEFDAVGAGAEHPLFNNDFYWTGSFVQSGLYYVLVESTGRGDATYRLTISGAEVSFPRTNAELACENGRCAADMSLAPTPPLTLTPQPGASDPPSTVSAENPLPPVGQNWALRSDATHWYAFRDEGDESSIQVWADASPDNCLTFQVWTPDQLRLWQEGETFRPIGQGTPNSPLKADLFWTGSFVKSGTYYIVVKRAAGANNLCSYKLWVTGDDVSLLLPSPDN